MEITAFRLASRYLGVKEAPGASSHPLIQWWLSLCDPAPKGLLQDETAWCAAFVHGIAWELDLPRSRSLGARTWLNVGLPLPPSTARQGDIVILQRGEGEQPGPGVIAAPGHVGFFEGWAGGGARVQLLGGNQSNAVTIQGFNADRILGVRRLG